MAQVKIEVVDENGLVVPDASSQVQLSVEGGTLVGLDNGNPRDHTSMKSDHRNTFNGLALAVIQSTNKAGIIHVQVSSPGLKTGSIDINAEKMNIPIEELK